MNSLKAIAFVAFLAGICYSAPAQDLPVQPANELDSWNSVVQDTLNNNLAKLSAQYSNDITEKIMSKLNETTKNLNEVFVSELSNEFNDLSDKLSNHSASFVESVVNNNVVAPKYAEIVDESFNKINKVMVKKLKSNIKDLIKSTFDILSGYKVDLPEFESKLLAQNQNSSIAEAIRENRLIAKNLVKDIFNQLDAEKEKALNVSVQIQNLKNTLFKCISL